MDRPMSKVPGHPFSKAEQTMQLATEVPSPLDWRLVLALEDQLLPVFQELQTVVTALNATALDQGTYHVLESEIPARIAEQVKQALHRISKLMSTLSELTLYFPGEAQAIPPLATDLSRHAPFSKIVFPGLPAAQDFVNEMVQGVNITPRLRERMSNHCQKHFSQITAQLVRLVLDLPLMVVLIWFLPQSMLQAASEVYDREVLFFRSMHERQVREFLFFTGSRCWKSHRGNSSFMKSEKRREYFPSILTMPRVPSLAERPPGYPEGILKLV
jgi:hypothetical protein